jgi:hypothetical protein
MLSWLKSSGPPPRDDATRMSSLNSWKNSRARGSSSVACGCCHGPRGKPCEERAGGVGQGCVCF